MPIRAPWLRYAVAFGATALAVALRLALDPVVGSGTVPYITLFPAVVFIAWACGLIPTLATLPVGGMAVWFLILSPLPTVTTNATAAAGLITFLVTGSATAVLGDAASKGSRLLRERQYIQDRLRANAARARQSQEQLALVSDTVPALISYVDREFLYRFVNKAYTDWFGISAEDIVGRPMRDVLGEAAWGAIEAGMRRAMEGETADFETEARYARGGTRWIHAVYTPHRDQSGSVVGVVVMVFDITRRRQAEEALRDADRRKDEFLAILAHELRNPLAPIRTGLELLCRADAEPEIVQRIRPVLERQVAQMVRLIDDLVDVSRITLGKISLRRRPTPLSNLIQDALESNLDAFEAAGVDLVVRVPDLDPVLDVDPARFVQVLSNLLNNAAKFTNRGGRVTLDGTIEEGDGGPELVLTMHDTGVGIQPSLLPRIFDLFVQGEGAGRGRQGLGVGLALTKQIVELHDGRIEALSAGPGQGSTFTIRMPVLEMASVRAEPADSPSLVRIHRRVLVVDDNQEAADMISALVQSLGGDVRAAHGGEDGMRCAAEFNPDVILLDLGMPDMDGFETCRRLRAHAFGRHAFVVALTGWSQPQDRERARASGFDAFMTKPADAHALAELLARARRQESPAANA